MIIIDKYDNENFIDECWYDSSNILYSKYYDKKDSYKELDITFKGGKTYKYFDLIAQDYLLFKNGGLDGSNGKAFNIYIKKYKFEKIDDADVNMLNEKKKLLIEEKENLAKKEKNKEVLNEEQ